ncbi:MAG: DUF2339 domain-containing protein [Bacteroidetes bacterium]|nr:DUF2339 domain-containing protein [Bacteroidota bacterium]
MEIFLLLVLIVLMIYFHSTYNAKFKKLHNHIYHLQKELSDSFQRYQAGAQLKEGAVKPIIKVVPEKEIVPPIVVKEEDKIIDKNEKIPPFIIENKKEEPERVYQPVNDNTTINVNKPLTQPTQPSFWQRFKERNPDLEKFIGENLLSKIAITILVLGIAFFVKYAIDQEWINETGRVGIGVLCGSIVMVFAHKLRLSFKPFSSVLVAGAIAIFYFTIGIGFQEYHLFSQTVAFIMMLVITAFSVFISVAYDRIELAALSIIGGFAVPFMISTGGGNYQVLFSYILILDIGMLALAYIKKWNLINILTYVFTVILYSAWLGTRVINESFAPYKGAFLFGIVFYIVFVLMNVINNIKERRQFSYIELIILISNTFVFYGTGMLILNQWHGELKGVYTIVMALFNFMLAFALFRVFKADKKLVYLLIGLTLTFVTLAAPVQLKGNYITLFWGAEVALLIWLSQVSKLKAFKLASLVISLLMLFSLLMDWSSIYAYDTDGLKPVLNKGFVTGILSSFFLFVSVVLLKKEEGDETLQSTISPKIHGLILKIAAIFILYVAGFLEIHQQSSFYIYSTNSVIGISAFYHIVFTSVLGIVLVSKYSPANNLTSFILLCINILYYVFIYSIAPYDELKERCRAEHQSYFSYAVHFPALIAIALHVLILIKVAVKNNNFIIAAKSTLLWIGGVCAIYILSNEAILNSLLLKLNSFGRVDDYYIVNDIYDYMHTQVIKIALPILWGVIAFVFLSSGIKLQLKQLRIMALLLLALTLLKLFIYDINNVSEAGKIIAFIILGVVLLIMSFMYQKIKALILSEESLNNNITDHENKAD